MFGFGKSHIPYIGRIQTQSILGDAQQTHSEVYGQDGQPDNQASWTGEALGGAAAFEAMRKVRILHSTSFASSLTQNYGFNNIAPCRIILALGCDILSSLIHFQSSPHLSYRTEADDHHSMSSTRKKTVSSSPIPARTTPASFSFSIILKPPTPSFSPLRPSTLTIS